MASYEDVSKAVIERIRPAIQTGWHTVWFKPAPPPVPSVCVCPDPNKYANYQVSHSSMAMWFLRLELYATANDRPAAYSTVSSLTDPDGPLISRLLADDIDDELFRLVGLNVAVVDGKGWRLRGGRKPYLMADIGVTVGAN